MITTIDNGNLPLRSPPPGVRSGAKLTLDRLIPGSSWAVSAILGAESIGSCSNSRLNRAYKRRVQRAQSWLSPVRRRRRDGRPFRRVRQIDYLSQVEFGVVAKPCGFVGCWVAVSQDREFAAMQRSGAPAGAIGDAHNELRGVIVENSEDQGWSRLGARADAVREATPHYFTSGGFTPPFHFDAISNRLERTERLTPCGTRFLICRS